MAFNINRALRVSSNDIGPFQCLAHMLIEAGGKVPKKVQVKILEQFKKKGYGIDSFQALIDNLKQIPVVERETLLGSVLSQLNVDKKNQQERNKLQEMLSLANDCGLWLEAYQGEDLNNDLVVSQEMSSGDEIGTLKILCRPNSGFYFEAPASMDENAIKEHNTAIEEAINGRPAQPPRTPTPNPAPSKASNEEIVDRVMKKLSEIFPSQPNAPKGSLAGIFNTIIGLIGPLMKLLMGITSMFNEISAESANSSAPKNNRTSAQNPTEREQAERLRKAQAAHAAGAGPKGADAAGAEPEREMDLGEGVSPGSSPGASRTPSPSPAPSPSSCSSDGSSRSSEQRSGPRR
jgi:hypothetical protein